MVGSAELTRPPLGYKRWGVRPWAGMVVVGEPMDLCWKGVVVTWRVSSSCRAAHSSAPLHYPYLPLLPLAASFCASTSST